MLGRGKISVSEGMAAASPGTRPQELELGPADPQFPLLSSAKQRSSPGSSHLGPLQTMPSDATCWLLCPFFPAAVSVCGRSLTHPQAPREPPALFLPAFPTQCHLHTT